MGTEDSFEYLFLYFNYRKEKQRPCTVKALRKLFTFPRTSINNGARLRKKTTKKSTRVDIIVFARLGRVI